MNHYFKSNENLRHKETSVEYVKKSVKFNFITDAGVFSKDGVDFATNILLETLINSKFDASNLPGKVLDLGCGYGAIGIVLAKIFAANVFMSDVNERALDLAKKNAAINGVSENVKIIKSDGFENIPGKFDCVVFNPPIHAGKPVIYGIYQKAFEHLNKNGGFYIVVQKKHGALSHKQKLEEIFGAENCRVLYSKKGFFIFELVS